MTRHFTKCFVNLRLAAELGLAAADFGGGEGWEVLAFEVFVGEKVAADDKGDEDGGGKHADDEEES
jgi:hypothetical protein